MNTTTQETACERSASSDKVMAIALRGCCRAPIQQANPQQGVMKFVRNLGFARLAALQRASSALHLHRKIPVESFMPDFAATDLAFAIGHHVLIFALAGVLAFEIGAVKPGIAAKEIVRIAKADRWYGIFAGLILIVGFARANFAAKGWAYYSHNEFFWAKIGAFALVALLSIPPTVQYIRWRLAFGKNPAFLPADSAVRTVRRFLWLEVFFFAWIPIFAAAMARGYGAAN
jgi:putative membrane protein